jgi:orotate phosphoribosyltransferase
MSLDSLEQEITRLLYEDGMITTWYRDRPEGWILQSKMWSPFYINLRRVGSTKNGREILFKAGQAMSTILKRDLPEVSKVVGVYMAGIPLATAITLQSGLSSCYARNLEGIDSPDNFDSNISDIVRRIKEHGEHALIEGELHDGDHLAIVDDLATKFTTKLITRKQVMREALDRGIRVTCNDAIVLLDREQGAAVNARRFEMNLHSVIPFKTKGVPWLKDVMSPTEYEVISDYLADEKKYQAENMRRKLRGLAKPRSSVQLA